MQWEYCTERLDTDLGFSRERTSILKTLGLELSKFSELSGRLEELLDVTLEVTKRTRGDYS